MKHVVTACLISKCFVKITSRKRRLKYTPVADLLKFRGQLCRTFNIMCQLIKFLMLTQH